MGSVSDCSRKEIRTLTRATVADIEKIEWMRYLGAKTIQIELSGLATWVQKANGGREFGFFSLIQSDPLLL